MDTNALFRQLGFLTMAAAAIGCSNAPSTSSGVLRVDQNISAGFDATYVQNEKWARVQVGYRASSDNIYPEYTITTSFGTTLLHEGVIAQAQPAAIDPRATAGWVVVTANDAEYDVVHGLFDKLMALGVAARPSPDEKASPLYGAAYSTAQVLGLDETRLAYGMTEADFAKVDSHAETFPVFPYPSHAGLQGDKLLALLAQISAIQGQDFVVPGLGACCGSCNNCAGCYMINGGACDDWCAAGDHCNQYHSSSGCGSIATWPGHCPHQDSGAINGAGGAGAYCSYHHGSA
jgi:hypothetical protein